MNEIAIAKVNAYIDERLFAPSRSWSDYKFEQRSYERWAAFEVIDILVRSRPQDAYANLQRLLLNTIIFSHMDDKFVEVVETLESILQLIDRDI